MTNNPPYTLTVKTADYLTKIAETVTRLEYGTGFMHDIKLHRQNRVRSIYSSLAIEGNTLSLEEVTDVIAGKLVAGKQAEVKEVKNAYEAYDKILTFNPYSIKDFLQAHKLMTGGLVKESGVFRSGDVGVFDGDAVVHVGARPQFVSQLIEELFAWAGNADLHPMLKSAIVHTEIETIHPFADGNGRMGRLWQTLILARWNEVFAWIPMESLVYATRPQYYGALQNAQKTNYSGGFIEFTLSVILEAVEMQARQISGQSSGAANGEVKFGGKFGERFGENQTQNKIIEMMKEAPGVSAKTIAHRLGITPRAVEKNIRALKEAGYIERTGSAKGGHWLVKKLD
jgi:Fic family protein